MARQYMEPVQVREASDGTPQAFTWRGLRYAPLEVIGSWHLKDKWWEATALREHSDRQYYRVMMPDHQVFELYRDVAGVWILDVIQD